MPAEELLVITDPFDLSSQIQSGTEDPEPEEDEEDDDKTKKPSKKVDPPAEEAEESEEEENEEDEEEEDGSEEEESDDFDASEYSSSALLALSYQKDGTFGEDFEIDKDLSGSDLKDKLSEAIEAELTPRIEEKVEQEWADKGYSEAQIQYGQIAASGREQDVKDHVAYTQLAEFKPETEKHKETLVTYMLKDMKMDTEDIQVVLDNISDADELNKRSNKAQKYFGDKAKELIDRATAEVKNEQEALRTKIKETENTFRTMIKGGTIGKQTLSVADKSALEKHFLVASVIIEGQNSEGKKTRQKVTPFMKWLSDVDKSPELKLDLALYSLRGKDYFSKKGANAARDQFLNTLDSSKGKRKTTKKKKSGSDLPDALDFGDNLDIDINF